LEDIFFLWFCDSLNVHYFIYCISLVVNIFVIHVWILTISSVKTWTDLSLIQNPVFNGKSKNYINSLKSILTVYMYIYLLITYRLKRFTLDKQVDYIYL
jgi:hypothetical protein